MMCAHLNEKSLLLTILPVVRVVPHWPTSRPRGRGPGLEKDLVLETEGQVLVRKND